MYGNDNIAIVLRAPSEKTVAKTDRQAMKAMHVVFRTAYLTVARGAALRPC